MKVTVKEEQNERKRVAKLGTNRLWKDRQNVDDEAEDKFWQSNVLAGRTEPDIRKHAAQWSNVRENEATEEIF